MDGSLTGNPSGTSPNLYKFAWTISHWGFTHHNEPSSYAELSELTDEYHYKVMVF
jgi:hypothetical protein